MDALILASRAGLLIIAVIPITVMVILLEHVEPLFVFVQAYLAPSAHVAAFVCQTFVWVRESVMHA